MARASIEFTSVQSTRDLIRFLEVLEALGVDVAIADHRVRVLATAEGGKLVASIAVEDLDLRNNDLVAEAEESVG